MDNYLCPTKQGFRVVFLYSKSYASTVLSIRASRNTVPLLLWAQSVFAKAVQITVGKKNPTVDPHAVEYWRSNPTKSTDRQRYGIGMVSNPYSVYQIVGVAPPPPPLPLWPNFLSYNQLTTESTWRVPGAPVVSIVSPWCTGSYHWPSSPLSPNASSCALSCILYP